MNIQVNITEQPIQVTVEPDETISVLIAGGIGPPGLQMNPVLEPLAVVDGSPTVFLSFIPYGMVMLDYNGSIQNPSEYSIVGKTVTFNFPLSDGDYVLAYYLH